MQNLLNPKKRKGGNNIGVITPKQGRFIRRAIGKELEPLWHTQVFQQADEAAKYLIQEAIARATLRLETEDIDDHYKI